MPLLNCINYRSISRHYRVVILIFSFSIILPSAKAQEQNPTITHDIDSVIIRARIESRSLMEKPYTEPKSILPAISRLTRKDIIATGANNVVEAMNYIPGALIETRGRQVKQFFSIRGQKYPYPDYAVNGVWQKEFEEIPYFFSTSDIEEIEIVRSSAALLTGLSGLTGLINIKTRDYSSPETNLEMEYGSFNSVHTHVSNGSRIGNFSYAAGLGYDKTNGPEGEHAKEDMTNLYAQAGWKPSDKLSIKANLFMLNGQRQLRVAQLPADKRYRDMIQNFDPVKTTLTNLKFIFRPTPRLSSEVQFFYAFRNPTFNDEVKLTSSNEKDSEYGLNFIQSFALSSLNTLRAGGLYNHWVAPNGKRFYTGKRCDTETFSAVLVDEHRIGAFTLDAGVRLTAMYLNDYGAFNIEGDGAQFKTVTPISDEWDPATLQGSLGASYHAGDLMSIYFNSAAGQVKPRQGALNTDMAVPLNETRYKLDLGFVRNFANSGKISLTAFSIIQKNAIALSGKVYTDAATNQTRELYLNRNQHQHGLELEVNTPNLYRFIQPFLNITFMKSFLNEDDNVIMNRENPLFIAAGGLYMKKKWLDINLLAKYVSEFENDRFATITDGPQPLGEYFTLDLSAGYTTHGRVPVRLYIKSRNLTNEKYSTVIGYPDFGRMIYAGVQVRFMKNAE